MPIDPISQLRAIFLNPPDKIDQKELAAAIQKLEATAALLYSFLEVARSIEKRALEKLRNQALSASEQNIFKETLESNKALLAALAKTLNNPQIKELQEILSSLNVKNPSQADLYQARGFGHEIQNILLFILQNDLLSQKLIQHLLAQGSLQPGSQFAQALEKLLAQYINILKKQLQNLNKIDPDNDVTLSNLEELNRLAKKKLPGEGKETLSKIIAFIFEELKKNQITQGLSSKALHSLESFFKTIQPLIQDLKHSQEDYPLPFDLLSMSTQEAEKNITGKIQMQELQEKLNFLHFPTTEKYPSIKQEIHHLTQTMDQQYREHLKICAPLALLFDHLEKHFHSEKPEFEFDAKKINAIFLETKHQLQKTLQDQTSLSVDWIDNLVNNSQISDADKTTIKQELHPLFETHNIHTKGVSDLVSHLSSVKATAYPKPDSITSVFMDQKGSIVNPQDPTVTSVKRSLTQVTSSPSSFGSSAPSSSTIGSSSTTSSSSPTGASSIQGSLPDAFKNLVLDEYMKNQQEFLLELAIALQSSNIAMDAISSVLNMISDFHSVSTIFNASSILSGSNPPWSAAAAQAFNNEKQSAENMFGKDGTGGEVNNAINKIKQEIKDIRDKMNAHPPQMNQETGNDVINDLKNSLKKLQNLQADGKTYMRFFSAISIKQDPPGSGKYYMYDGTRKLSPKETTSVIDDLSKMENELKNGPDAPDKIYSDLSSDQTTYQNQGTQQQIQLQMQMTEMQQEWAVVSTSLQMLNQMYMACANAISK